jgi:hypothetical protein
MSIRSTAVLRAAAVTVVAGFGMMACEQGSPTDPEFGGYPTIRDEGPLAALGTASYPGTKVPGRVTACKDANSPAGTYNFTASASAFQSGDMIASNFTLTPGTCAVVWERPSGNDPATNVTLTEVIPSGATYKLDHINAVDDAAGSRNVAGPSVTVVAKGQHGAVATFFNVPAAAPPPNPGHVVLCKAGNVAGTFNFKITAIGTITGDVVKAATTLAAGSCDTVFIRAKAGPVAATITITESLAANASVFLQNVTVNGALTATVGAAVVVTQNVGPVKVVVFTNARATVGTTVAYQPARTPGHVHLCKSSDSPPGTFNFTVNAIGTVATDQVVSNVSLTAGTCKVIFIRTVPQVVSATITVTENLAVGSLIVLDRIVRVTSTGTAVSTGSLGVVVTENLLTNGGSLVTFFNKRISLVL